MHYYLVLLLAIVINSSASAQTIDPEKDSLHLVPKNQIGLTVGMNGYQVSAMGTYKRAHLKSSIGTMAGFNMGYWYFGLAHAKNFYDANRDEFELVQSYDSVTVYRAFSEFEKYYGIQFGRSREVRSCDRKTYSGFQFSFDYYAFLNYGERRHRYQDEYLTLGTPSTQWWNDNNLSQTVQYGDRIVTSLNAGLGVMIGLDMVFAVGNGPVNDKRNFILGFKYGVPNVGVDIPIGEKSVVDPLNVFTEPTDQISMTFYHQALLKLGYCF